MIRKMELADAARMAEIHVYGWRSAYRGIVSDDFLFNNMQVVKRLSVFENTFNSIGNNTYVYDDGIVKAFMTIGSCRDDDKPCAFELWGLYVDPFMQNQGVGSKLVDFCINRASKDNYTEIYLWVLEKNLHALQFYESKGFVPDGTRKYLEALDAVEIRCHRSIVPHNQRT